MTTLDPKALEAVRAAPFRKYTIGETIDDTAIETIITAYLAALPAQPVAAWKMVPIEPTEEMRMAGAYAIAHLPIGSVYSAQAAAAHAAMLKAAPLAAPSQQEGVTEAWRVVIDIARGRPAHAC